MARLVAARSTDILFPEDGGKNTSDLIYSPPSTSSHSSLYSREVRCILDAQYARPRQNFEQDHQTRVVHSRPPKHNNHRERENQARFRQYNPPPKRKFAESRQLPQPPLVDHNSNAVKHDPFASRRRTWSPPAFEKMGSGTSLYKLKSYRSNDALDDNENIYEVLDPPPLAPSGTLNQTSKRAVIKPVAFKPISTTHSRYVSTPHHRGTTDPRIANVSQDDGYASQDYSHGHSGSNLSHNSSHNSSGHADSDRSVSFSGDVARHYNPPSDVFMSSNISRISGNSEHFMHTPSPSDSGVGELEAMLRDKDAEILQLRETMEVNERAIIQVYEEKIQNLQMELKEVHDDYEGRLRKCQDKAFRTEQALLLQLFKLQQERKTVKADTELLKSEKDKSNKKCGDLDEEIKKLKCRLEEVEWELCQKSGEISLLKSQLKESKEETGTKSNDILALKTQIKDLNESKEDGNKEMQRLKQEVIQLQSECECAKQEKEKLQKELSEANKEHMVPVKDVSHSPSSQTESQLRSELARLKLELESSHVDFDKERDQWMSEKEKVIRYQKQLQLNYVQMCRKNRMLEQEVQQLTLELENRDISLLPDGEAPVEQESMC